MHYTVVCMHTFFTRNTTLKNKHICNRKKVKLYKNEYEMQTTSGSTDSY